MKTIRRVPGLLLGVLVLGGPAQAADVELAFSLGQGYPIKKDLYRQEDLGSGSATFIQTRFSGPWNLGGLQASLELYKHEALKLWAGAGFVSGLGAPGYFKFGQNTVQGTNSTTEMLEGSGKYRRYQAGLGATWSTRTLGEYGAFLWMRSNRLTVSGTRTLITQQDLNPAPTLASSHSSLSNTANDAMLELSMAFVQPRPTFKTFERISFGTAFGHGFGEVGSGSWQLEPTYPARLRPTVEIRFTLGVRL